MNWPAHSPDMNPIQHLVRHSKKTGSPPPITVVEPLQIGVVEEWDSVLQDKMQLLIYSTPRITVLGLRR